MIKALIMILMGMEILTGSCQAQVGFTVRKNTVLTAAAEVITLQQPATGSKTVNFIGFYIDCSVACTVTLERNGAAATSTALTVNNINPNEPTIAGIAWSSSNV